jgi:hypothetical protein
MPSEVHPFSGQLVDGKQAYNWLIDALPRVDRPVSLCSAFLRSEALWALFPKGTSHINGRILVRWQLGDLQAGASDLQAYSVAKEMGFKLFVRQDFHGKVFALPGRGLVVGSANATLAGFGLRDVANAEVCTLVSASESNFTFIDDLFSGAVEMDDSLFEAVRGALQDHPVALNEYGQWPPGLLKQFQCRKPAKWLLLSECLLSLAEVDIAGNVHVQDEHDRQLLGLKGTFASKGALTIAFKELKLFRWFYGCLVQANGEMYFGAASNALHNALLDDPGVLRRNVKAMLQVLLAWCELIPQCGVTIDRPSHSQRIRLVDSTSSIDSAVV